ncbi:hypothetical protein HK097_002813 [Rhizophlyctis rosea]|uniref:ZZ-type domain-containing protein n=1 Tax=Rhizophlyctis rosea TaxID=64517 RepID=A0AAD5X717_9FUNG|nr:hypothetical protein HK097_002813 [Rhizophlyctis rosea]
MGAWPLRLCSTCSGPVEVSASATYCPYCSPASSSGTQHDDPVSLPSTYLAPPVNEVYLQTQPPTSNVDDPDVTLVRRRPTNTSNDTFQPPPAFLSPSMSTSSQLSNPSSIPLSPAHAQFTTDPLTTPPPLPPRTSTRVYRVAPPLAPPDNANPHASSKSDQSGHSIEATSDDTLIGTNPTPGEVDAPDHPSHHDKAGIISHYPETGETQSTLSHQLAPINADIDGTFPDDATEAATIRSSSPPPLPPRTIQCSADNVLIALYPLIKLDTNTPTDRLLSLLTTIFHVLDDSIHPGTSRHWEPTKLDAFHLLSSNHPTSATHLPLPALQLYYSTILGSTYEGITRTIPLEPSHPGKICNSCGAKNFRGIRYKCTKCIHYDVCDVCYVDIGRRHYQGHWFREKYPVRAGLGHASQETGVEVIALTFKDVQDLIVFESLRDPNAMFACLAGVTKKYKLPFRICREELPPYPIPSALELDALARSNLSEWAEADRVRKEAEREALRIQMEEEYRRKSEERRRRAEGQVYVPGPVGRGGTISRSTEEGMAGVDSHLQARSSMETAPVPSPRNEDKGKGPAIEYLRNAEAPPTPPRTPFRPMLDESPEESARRSQEWVERVKIGSEGKELRL